MLGFSEELEAFQLFSETDLKQFGGKVLLKK
jgi:hypothetical protein